MTADDYADLVGLVRSFGIPCLLDTSGDLLKRGIEAHPTMIKPNADEIGQLLGREISGDKELLRAAVEIHRNGVAYVVISLGAKGAFMVCGEGVFHGQVPKINAINPVGAGDTLVGTFAVGLIRKYGAQRTLAFALACASASCLMEGTGRFDLEDASKLEAQTRVKRITL